MKIELMVHKEYGSVYVLTDDVGKEFFVPQELADLNDNQEKFVLAEALFSGAVVA